MFVNIAAENDGEDYVVLYPEGVEII